MVLNTEKEKNTDIFQLILLKQFSINLHYESFVQFSTQINFISILYNFHVAYSKILWNKYAHKCKSKRR